MFGNSLSFVFGVGLGIYIAQNYNVPDIKLLLQKGYKAAKALEKAARKDDYDDDDVCVLCTGSQGESMAVLALLARGDSQDLSVGAGDVVLLSSHPIPGNERSVFAVVNALVARGAEVVHSGQVQVHTSGHARRDELREFHGAMLDREL